MKSQEDVDFIVVSDIVDGLDLVGFGLYGTQNIQKAKRRYKERRRYCSEKIGSSGPVKKNWEIWPECDW